MQTTTMNKDRVNGLAMKALDLAMKTDRIDRSNHFYAKYHKLWSLARSVEEVA